MGIWPKPFDTYHHLLASVPEVSTYNSIIWTLTCSRWMSEVTRRLPGGFDRMKLLPKWVKIRINFPTKLVSEVHNYQPWWWQAGWRLSPWKKSPEVAAAPPLTSWMFPTFSFLQHFFANSSTSTSPKYPGALLSKAYKIAKAGTQIISIYQMISFAQSEGYFKDKIQMM